PEHPEKLMAAWQAGPRPRLPCRSGGSRYVRCVDRGPGWRRTAPISFGRNRQGSAEGSDSPRPETRTAFHGKNTAKTEEGNHETHEINEKKRAERQKPPSSSSSLLLLSCIWCVSWFSSCLLLAVFLP